MMTKVFLVSLLALLTAAPAAAQGTPLNKPMRLDQEVSYAAGNGCRYTATVRGLVTPIGNDQVDPNVLVRAEVDCPHASAIKITDNVTSTGPLTRTGLEKILDRRATVTTDGPGRQCAYVPELSVDPNGAVKLAKVSSLGEPTRPRGH